MYNIKIHEWSEKKGYRIGIGGIELLRIAEKELNQWKKTKEIDPAFFEENLNSFDYYKDHEVTQPSSLIIVAIPRPAHTISFDLGTEVQEMVLPPTYRDYRSLFETTRLELEEQVFSGKVRVKTLSAPLKAMAGLLGIVSYGRNNITYVPKFGSYLQLVGFLVDTPLVATKSAKNFEKLMLKECAKCRACSKACPREVISDDRFLIRAERCFTLYSESHLPILDGIHPPSLDCIIGCMKCQVICPANKGRLRYEKTDVSFSKAETKAFLDSSFMNPELKKAIEAKFTSLGVSENADIFIRNFRHIMEIRKNETDKGVNRAK